MFSFTFSLPKAGKPLILTSDKKAPVDVRDIEQRYLVSNGVYLPVHQPDYELEFLS
jgi:hypothetical protein